MLATPLSSIVRPKCTLPLFYIHDVHTVSEVRSYLFLLSIPLPLAPYFGCFCFFQGLELSSYGSVSMVGSLE